MPGLWPPPHQVAAVGVLGRREDGEAWLGLQFSWPLLEVWPVSTPILSPSPLSHWASGGQEKACYLSYCRPFGMSSLVS